MLSLNIIRYRAKLTWYLLSVENYISYESRLVGCKLGGSQARRMECGLTALETQRIEEGSMGRTLPSALDYNVTQR